MKKFRRLDGTIQEFDPEKAECFGTLKLGDPHGRLVIYFSKGLLIQKMYKARFRDGFGWTQIDIEYQEITKKMGVGYVKRILRQLEADGMHEEFAKVSKHLTERIAE